MIDAVVFDLGGVLIDWNPQRLYRQLIPDAAARARFLAEVCPQSWNERQDAGRPLAAATAERIALFPQHAELIAAYYGRWEDMLAGAIDDAVAVLEALHRRGVPLYALSNWSAELFPIARHRFAFLDRFRGIVVSGEEGLIKPDAAIFRVLCERHGLAPAACLFIDDNPANVAAAAALGFAAHQFTSAAALRACLNESRLL
ncbi:MAG: HAD family phosphatase [Rhodocyclaceae bacterium]|nr:HAD family phosphatase [Rhodocyclaceae bacterium]